MIKKDNKITIYFTANTLGLKYGLIPIYSFMINSTREFNYYIDFRSSYITYKGRKLTTESYEDYFTLIRDKKAWLNSIK